MQSVGDIPRQFLSAKEVSNVGSKMFWDLRILLDDLFVYGTYLFSAKREEMEPLSPLLERSNKMFFAEITFYALSTSASKLNCEYFFFFVCKRYSEIYCVLHTIFFLFVCLFLNKDKCFFKVSLQQKLFMSVPWFHSCHSFFFYVRIYCISKRICGYC